MKRKISTSVENRKSLSLLSPLQKVALAKSLRMMQKQCAALQRRKIFNRAECEETSMAAIMLTLRGCRDARLTKEELMSWGKWLFQAVAGGDVDALNRMLVITNHLKKGKPLSSLTLKDLGLSTGRGNPGRTITNKMIFCSAATYIVVNAIAGEYLPSRERLRTRIKHERKALGAPPPNYQSWESELQRDITHYGLKGLLTGDD